MSKVRFSVAMAEAVHVELAAHLLRSDEQEDLCFALWRPSTGRFRTTALLVEVLLPLPGDRMVHGNASFQPKFFERALGIACESGCGLALLHSHPHGHGWQGMSPDDIAAESGHAAVTYAGTGLPLIGLTLAGNQEWSARFWPRTAPKTFLRQWCGSVRIVGDQLQAQFNDELAPPPIATDEQIRTISSWGEESQRTTARLRIGIIGAGSVGGLIGEALARIGIEDVVAIDFDKIEPHNLDRLCYATRDDVGKWKVDVFADRLRAISTATQFKCDVVRQAVYEEDGFRAALDCDLLFSCVDRPWGRDVLNVIAYAHHIPVVDGGIAVRVGRNGKLVAADWRAHVVAVGRQCLKCLGQYLPEHVQAEREGQLDDQKYINGLPVDHAFRARENVFPFAMACASAQVLQMISLVIAPLREANVGAERFRFVTRDYEKTRGVCADYCSFPGYAGVGDNFPYPVAITSVERQNMSSEPADGGELEHHGSAEPSIARIESPGAKSALLRAAQTVGSWLKRRRSR